MSFLGAIPTPTPSWLWDGKAREAVTCLKNSISLTTWILILLVLVPNPLLTQTWGMGM